MPFSYEHPRPALAVDCAVLGLHEGDLKVLLIKRGLLTLQGQVGAARGLCAHGGIGR